MIRRNQGRTDLLLYQAEMRGQPLGTVRIGREELGPYSPCIVRVGLGTCAWQGADVISECSGQLARVVASVMSTLCDTMDCSPPGPSVHGILQAGILEWIVMSSSRGSS